MNYQIITDENLLKEFIDWLPDLKDHEKYYFCLFARNKYCKQLVHIKSDKAQLKRGVSNKERLFEKIKQLEIELDAYKQKDKSVPQEAVALYITPNPRDMYKASINTMVKLAQSIRDQNVMMNPHQEALSEIQKSKSRTCYIDFDIDAHDRQLIKIIKEIKTYVNEDAITWLKTRGGVHCLVDPKLVEESYKKTFYNSICGIPEVDQAGDQIMPVPGTYQGGYTPSFIKL